MPSLFLPHRAGELVERMDEPECDPEKLARTYGQFKIINRLLSGWGRIYSRYILPELQAGARSILDIGAGGGDIAAMLHRRATSDGFCVQITATDTDERAVQFMRSSLSETEINIRRESTEALVESGKTFDIVLSNNVLHHISEMEVATFLNESRLLATRLVIHGDIRRDDLAYLGFLPAHIVFRGSFIAEDGLISIRKSYRIKELRSLLPVGWEIQKLALFRNLCLWRA